MDVVWHQKESQISKSREIAVVETDGEGKHTLHYILKDHLGSWTTITDSNGDVEQELSFDAWGNRRDPNTWFLNWNNPVYEEPMFDRGYTGHEHLYAFGLINMNGRCYDPVMSSFLSVDAYVQSPDNSQNFNRYAYCLNNPLKYTDPSGWRTLGASLGTHTTGAAEWGTNYAPVYEPRDLYSPFARGDAAMALLTSYRVGNCFIPVFLEGGGGGCSNSGEGGGGIELSGFKLLTQDAWKRNPSLCKFYCFAMIEYYFFGDNGRNAKQIKKAWTELQKDKKPDGNTEMALYKEVCLSMGYSGYDMGDNDGNIVEGEILSCMEQGDPIMLLSYYETNDGILTSAHARIICGTDYTSDGKEIYKIADPMSEEFKYKTYDGLLRDDNNKIIYNKLLFLRYSK